MTLGVGLPSEPSARKESFPAGVKPSLPNARTEVPPPAGNGRAPIVPPSVALRSDDPAVPAIESYVRSLGGRCQHTRYSCLVPATAYQSWTEFQSLTADSSKH